MKTLTPAQRFVRTVVQAVLAVLVAIPAAVATLDLPARTASKVVGVAAAAVVIISAVQNSIEGNAGP